MKAVIDFDQVIEVLDQFIKERGVEALAGIARVRDEIRVLPLRQGS
jgi:hypothetical protein